MKRMPLIPATLLAACLATVSAVAQGPRTIRVCATLMENSAAGMSSAAARDRLVKDLGHQKDKKMQLSMEGVAVDATAGEQIMAEAKQKNCEFLVEPKLTEAHEQGGVSGRAGNASNVPEYSATIEYKLFRVADGATAGSGAAKATDVGSQAEIVGQALDHLAGKVFAEVKKAGTPAP